MKINDWQRLTSTSNTRSVSSKDATEPSGTASGAQRKDAIVLSVQARELLEAQKTGNTRAEQVDNLRIAVEHGTYKIDAHTLAEKLMRHLDTPVRDEK
ncbi:MAG: flagellar biosynthesis anti-sigma factor FlgM [Paenibacillaceae bacterium]|jgi:flagellar biosynthesis anti-sigma factor FlgM|nr:flagellar biosynthesis anti-sigma factor FlgM [Paenibacillaceae bacterium]